MALRSLLAREGSETGWWLLTVVLGVTVALVLWQFLGALVLGVFVYYATRPVYERMAGRIGVPSLAAFAALFLIALPVIVLIAYTVLVAVAEVRTLTGTELALFGNLLQPFVDLPSLPRDPQQLVTVVVSDPGQFQSFWRPEAFQQGLGVVAAYVDAFVSALLNAFIALTVAFYLLRDDHRLAAWFRAAVTDADPAFDEYARVVDQDLQTIYFGNILNAFVVAVVAGISYNALDLLAPAGISIPTPTLLGLLTGAASLIPVVGMKLVYVPVGVYLLGVALVVDSRLAWVPIAFLVVSLVVVDGLTEVLLRPYISGRNLHVGLVLFAYILGPLFFGWYGLFLGPLLLVLVVHLARIVVPDLVRGGAVTPGAVGGDPIPDADASDAVGATRPAEERGGSGDAGEAVVPDETGDASHAVLPDEDADAADAAPPDDGADAGGAATDDPPADRRGGTGDDESSTDGT